MRIPISEKEKGLIYPLNKDRAFFISENSSHYEYYNKRGEFEHCTFEIFKKIYPYKIFYNYHSIKIKKYF